MNEPRYRPLRLSPGDDLRRSLAARVCGDAAQGASAFVVCGIGSLSDPTLRFAGAASATRLSGPFEIIALSGSITPDGAHLHMAVADEDGRVFAGHVGDGNAIRTTAEILLLVLPEWALRRRLDAATGFMELVVDEGP